VNHTTSPFFRFAHIQAVWESSEHHKNFKDRPGFPGIIGLGPSIDPEGTKFKCIDVNFIQDPFIALSAPTTEIVEMTLKEGKTKEDLYEVLTVLASKLDVDAPYPPTAWGESQDETKRYGLVLGWNNSKVNLSQLFFIYLALISLL